MSGTRVSAILVDLIATSRTDRLRTLPMILCDNACRDLAVDGVGLWLMTVERVQLLVAATDGVARTLEDLQFETGEGPCIDAFTSRHPVVQPDLARTAPDRWPVFAQGAVEAGAGAVFAFPLVFGDVRLGVLDLYRRQPGPLDDDDVALALAYADAAGIVLLHLQDEALAELDPALDGGWPTRGEVHQASGMVAVQAGVSVSEGLMLLRARAYAEGRSVGAVAADVLDRVLRFSSPERHDD